MRIGHGYDAHRFCDNKKLVVGGVEVQHNKGLLAHSDGDVLLHALCDSLLGAAGEKDIGYLFPDNSSEFLNIDSTILLKRTYEIVLNKGFSLEYADMTIIAQTPKFSPYIDSIKEKIASVMNVPLDRINVKATTEEKMGFTGREEGIAAHCVCILSE